MPIYEYRCRDCGGVTEAFLRNRQEAGEVRCKHCGSERLERTYLSPIASVRIGAKQERVPCCGEQEGCSHPKRCCEH
jgi:putative FmdB family regulatory protein